MKVYKLSWPNLIFISLILGVLALIGLSILINGIFRGEAPGLLKGFFVLWLGLLAWILYAFLRIPFTITLKDDNSLELTSVLQKTIISPQDIISIKGAPWSLGFIDLKHRGGTVKLISRMTGFYELIATVKALNPAIEVEGG